MRILLDPDCAIATDVTIPGDHPGIEMKDAPVEMGKGPVITIVDSSGRGLIASRKVVKWLKDTADSQRNSGPAGSRERRDYGCHCNPPDERWNPQYNRQHPFTVYSLARRSS